MIEVEIYFEVEGRLWLLLFDFQLRVLLLYLVVLDGLTVAEARAVILKFGLIFQIETHFSFKWLSSSRRMMKCWYTREHTLLEILHPTHRRLKLEKLPCLLVVGTCLDVLLEVRLPNVVPVHEEVELFL